VILHYTSIKVAVWISSLILVGYWIMLYAFGDANDPYGMIGYAGNAVDLAATGEEHLYHGEGIAFDPEGLLSTLPAIVNVIAGYFTGMFIRQRGNNYETIAKLMIAGSLAILAALTWDMAFPINKKIWTSSYVLLTVGLDLFMLAILIFYIEMRKKTKWTYFFLVFGRNPLFIYVVSGLLLQILYFIPVGNSTFPRWLYADFFGSFLSPLNASLMFALTYTMMNWLVGYWLDKRRIYIKV